MRRTLCTKEMIKSISDNLTLGLSQEDSSVLAGISETTFYVWQIRGETEIRRRARPKVRKGSRHWNREQIYVEFVEAIQKAIASRKRLHLGRIQKAAQGGNVTKVVKRVFRSFPNRDGDGNVTGHTRYLHEETITETTIPPSWQAAMTLLERQHPKEFGRQLKVIADWREKVPEEKQALYDAFFSHAIEQARARARK